MDFGRALLAGMLAAVLVAGPGHAATARPSVVIEMEPPADEEALPPAKLKLDAEALAADRRAAETVQRRLRETILAKVEFRDATLREALTFLARKTGVPMVVLSPVLPGEGTTPDQPGAPALPGLSQEPSPAPAGANPITLFLKDVPAGEVLRYVTAAAGLKWSVEAGAVLVVPIMCVIRTIEARDFPVVGAFREALAAVRPEAYAKEAEKIFKEKGVNWPPGSRVQYDAAKKCLTVRTTEESLDALEDLLDDPAAKREAGGERGFDREIWRSSESRQRLAGRRVRKVEIHEAPMADIVREMRLKICGSVEAQADPAVRVNLSLRDVSVAEMMRRIAEQAGVRGIVGSVFLVFAPPLPETP